VYAALIAASPAGAVKRRANNAASAWCVEVIDMGEPIRVLVVEASALMRQAVSQRLRSSDAVVVGEAGTNAETLVEYAQRHPDVVTVEVRLGAESGFDLVADLLESDPGAVVVVYSRLEDPELARQAVAAGAAGYIRKDASRAELRDCLRLVLRDVRPVFDRRTRAEVRSGAAPEATDRPRLAPHLTARQRQVLEVMVSGTTSNKGIATELLISEKTVKSHIERIAASLDVSSRTQLALRALELGLIATTGQPAARPSAYRAGAAGPASTRAMDKPVGTAVANSGFPAGGRAVPASRRGSRARLRPVLQKPDRRLSFG